MTIYQIQLWNPTTRKYETRWTGNVDYAEVMYNKPYIARHTRQLVEVSVTVLKKDKAKK